MSSSVSCGAYKLLFIKNFLQFELCARSIFSGSSSTTARNVRVNWTRCSNSCIWPINKLQNRTEIKTSFHLAPNSRDNKRNDYSRWSRDWCVRKPKERKKKKRKKKKRKETFHFRSKERQREEWWLIGLQQSKNQKNYKKKKELGESHHSVVAVERTCYGNKIKISRLRWIIHQITQPTTTMFFWQTFRMPKHGRRRDEIKWVIGFLCYYCWARRLFQDHYSYKCISGMLLLLLLLDWNGMCALRMYCANSFWLKYMCTSGVVGTGANN